MALRRMRRERARSSAPPPARPVERVGYVEAADRADASRVMRQRYCMRESATGAQSAGSGEFPLIGHFATAGRLRSDLVFFPGTGAGVGIAGELCSLTVLLDGEVEFSAPGDVRRRFTRGDVVAHPAGWALHGRWCDAEHLALTIPFSVLDRVAWADGAATARVEMTGTGARSPELGARWRRLAAAVNVETNRPRSLAAHALIEPQLCEYVAVTVLDVFPNTASDRVDASASTRSHCGPRTMARALAFIDGNLDRPMDTCDIAAAARTSPSELRCAFTIRRGQTVLEHLRQQRIRAASAELRSADRGTSPAAAVAGRWGLSPAEVLAAPDQ